jgi:hypothetical protein
MLKSKAFVKKTKKGKVVKVLPLSLVPIYPSMPPHPAFAPSGGP